MYVLERRRMHALELYRQIQPQINVNKLAMNKN